MKITNELNGPTGSLVGSFISWLKLTPYERVKHLLYQMKMRFLPFGAAYFQALDHLPRDSWEPRMGRPSWNHKNG